MQNLLQGRRSQTSLEEYVRDMQALSLWSGYAMGGDGADGAGQELCLQGELRDMIGGRQRRGQRSEQI